MKKIKSFQVDHTKIDKGLYISRIDGNIITYDLRMVLPNIPPFLENAGIHTFEHLLATYLRNTPYADKMVYIGPMGCRTGFYILTQNLKSNDFIAVLQNALKFISEFDGDIPGKSEKECGNYLNHDLIKAKKYASDFYKVIKDWSIEKLEYNN